MSWITKDDLALNRLIGLSVLLYGCSNPQPAYVPDTETFHYAGHDYLRFYDLGGVSVVHDPECQCQK